MNKEKSDVLVQSSRGDWLRVWFMDKDVQPFKDPNKPAEEKPDKEKTE